MTLNLLNELPGPLEVTAYFIYDALYMIQSLLYTQQTATLGVHFIAFGFGGHSLRPHFGEDTLSSPEKYLLTTYGGMGCTVSCNIQRKRAQIRVLVSTEVALHFREDTLPCDHVISSWRRGRLQ